MAPHRQRFSLRLFAFIACARGGDSATFAQPAFTGSLRLPILRPDADARSSRRRAFPLAPRDVPRPRPCPAGGPPRPGQSSLASRPAEDDGYDDALARAAESGDLDGISSFLRSHPSSVPSLSDERLRSIFGAVEMATAGSDENTVNKRAIEDAYIESASSGAGGGAGAGVEFRAEDRVRSRMTELYSLLRDGGRLEAFGAVGRPSAGGAPSCYPAAGSKFVTPTLLEQITGMEMASLTPRPTNFLLYGGATLALLEGVASIYFGVSFNVLVALTLILALADQLIVSGAVFETALRIVMPEMTSRVTRHEAGHFLCAYLLGCPVEGVVLSTWASLGDGRFGGRSAWAGSAGTSYYDRDLSEQVSGARPLTRDSIDRYSVIVMGGIAAEAVEFGRADGGAGDEEALVRFLRSLNPRSGNAVSSWTPDLIRNQARWGATQAVLLLREYKPCYDALVDALERGGDLGACIAAIERAARREGLGRLEVPVGKVFYEGEYGKWVPGDDFELFDDEGNDADIGGSIIERAHGVPTYGEDPITSTEEFLRRYRDVMEKKLASIDEQLGELDGKNNN